MEGVTRWFGGWGEVKGGCNETLQLCNDDLFAGGNPNAVQCSASNMAPFIIHLLKPTGYVMHQQFNIQQLYVLPTLYLCVLYLSQNKQRLASLTA